MNIRDLEQYPKEVQEEVRRSMRRMAAGHYEAMCPSRPTFLYRYLRPLWRAKERVAKWCRILWRKMAGPDAFYTEAANLPVEKFKEKFK